MSVLKNVASLEIYFKYVYLFFSIPKRHFEDTKKKTKNIYIQYMFSKLQCF